LEFSGTTPVAEDAERVHLAIDPPLRGDGRPVPLRAIVFLRSSEDAHAMRPVAADEALRDLWALAARTPNYRGREAGFAAVAKLASQIPIWNLYRPHDLGRIHEAVDLIVKDCFSDGPSGSQSARG
jgi:hypothetical protein